MVDEEDDDESPRLVKCLAAGVRVPSSIHGGRFRTDVTQLLGVKVSSCVKAASLVDTAGVKRLRGAMRSQRIFRVCRPPAGATELYALGNFFI